jgi:peptidoglycan hydrolase CwlO-like protein
MDVEILLHGVPSGQDYYGLKEEQKITESFYSSSNESVKFVVEAKKNGNNPYLYYTYLRYKGIVGAGGRPGSYIGITLRLDMYYTDVVHMYNLLDIAFKKYIVGSLLTPTGESYKYISPDFSSKKSEIEQLQQGILQLIQSTCVFSKFVKIDNSFINQITNAPTCNIADITEGTMSATIKKYSKVVLSPDYKSNLEKEYEKKVEDAEGRGGSIVAEKEKKIAEKDSIIAQKDATISSLNTKISARDAEIATLKQDNKRQEQELAQNKQKGKVAQLIREVKEPITSLSNYFRVTESEARQPTPKFGKKNFYVGIANAALSIVVIALLVILAISTIKPFDGKESKELATLKTQYANLQGKYNSLESLYDELNSEYQALITTKDADAKKKESLEAKKKAEAEAKKKAEEEAKRKAEAKKKAEAEAKKKAEATQTPDPIQFTIVMEPNVNEVEIGKEYTFSIKGYEGEGLWKMDGFESASPDKTSHTIVVKAIKVDGTNNPVISYTPEGRNDSKQRKQLKYKANE